MEFVRNFTDSDCVRYFWALVKLKRKFIDCVKFVENILDAMSRTQSPNRAPLEEDYVGKSLWFESSNVISTSQLTTTPQWWPHTSKQASAAKALKTLPCPILGEDLATNV